jgi:HTH-type transcriptional regulator, global nitrogen regulator NrpRI
MAKKIEKIRMAILKTLQDLDKAAGASQIQRHLLSQGIELQPRTIRFHLLHLDQDGLTQFISRRQGREITSRGREELARADIAEKVGFVATKIDTLGYRMSFNTETGTGTVIPNITTVRESYLARALSDMRSVFTRKLAMGTRLAIVHEGEQLGGLVVPPGMVAIGTVCSVTVNGILLSQGIPVTSRFGALLEIKDGRPVRFVELINYTGTTLDPLEIFIQAGMTRVRQCARSGRGIIGASFREFPSVAIDDVHRLKKKMEQCGLSSILAIGNPNQPLFDVPVAEGRTGMIVVAGLNPIAALHEVGARMAIQSLSGLEAYERFQSFDVFTDRGTSRSPVAPEDKWQVE